MAILSFAFVILAALFVVVESINDASRMQGTFQMPRTKASKDKNMYLCQSYVGYTAKSNTKSPYFFTGSYGNYGYLYGKYTTTDAALGKAEGYWIEAGIDAPGNKTNDPRVMTWGKFVWTDISEAANPPSKVTIKKNVWTYGEGAIAATDVTEKIESVLRKKLANNNELDYAEPTDLQCMKYYTANAPVAADKTADDQFPSIDWSVSAGEWLKPADAAKQIELSELQFCPAAGSAATAATLQYSSKKPDTANAFGQGTCTFSATAGLKNYNNRACQTSTVTNGDQGMALFVSSGRQENGKNVMYALQYYNATWDYWMSPNYNTGQYEQQAKTCDDACKKFVHLKESNWRTRVHLTYKSFLLW
jgi:hypothetical protein